MRHVTVGRLFSRPIGRWRGLALLVVAVLAIRLIWGWYVGHQVAGELAGLRAQGEPVSLSDLKYDKVPDAENAVLLQVKAVNALSLTVLSPFNSNITYVEAPPFSPPWMKLAEASEKADASAFDLLHRSRRLSRAQFPTSRWAGLGTTLNGLKFLAMTACDSALYLHAQGDDAGALERLLDVLHLSRSLREDDNAVSQVMASGCEARVCESTMLIVLHLGLGSGTARRPATQTQIAKLIGQLLDDSGTHQGMRRSARLARADWIDGLLNRGESLWLLRPLADREVARAVAYFQACIKAADCASNAPVQAILKPAYEAATIGMVPRMPGSVPAYARCFGEWLFDWRITYEHLFHVIADRRATAVSLACQLCRTDHGNWPVDLQALVPQYLPAVPLDPFFDDGRPLGYVILKGTLPGGGDRVLVYFDPGTNLAPSKVPDVAQCAWRMGPHGEVVRQYRDIAPMPAPISP